MLLPPESPAQRLGCPVDASHPVSSHKVNHAGQGGTRTRACLSFQPGGNQGTRSGRAAGGSFSDTTKTLAGPDPCWLDHGPQSWLLGRISSPFFPGSPPAPETRTGLEWPGHGSFWNCSGVFTDTKNLRTPLKLHPCLSEYLMILKEIPGSITNLQWAFVLRKVSCRVPVTAQQ